MGEVKKGSIPTSPGSSSRKVQFDEEVEVIGIAKKIKNIEGKLRTHRVVLEPTVEKIGTELNQKAAATVSYVDATKTGPTPRQVNFRFLETKEKQEGVDVVLPKESVRLIQSKLAFTLYGYFLGDRLAYPVVDQFVAANWKKFGIQKSMMNANGFFFFKFTDEKGMREVLEGGPWMIRNKPIILNIWTPSSSLKKEDITKASIWVKLHDVPLAAFSEDGLSMLASKIGGPRMLDTHTSTMCAESWGRSSYARALIEVSAEHELKESLSIAIPDSGESYTKVSVGVEYEWKPPRCSHCRVFGHEDSSCPFQTLVTNVDPQPVTQNKPKDDGYTEVGGKKKAKKKGIQVNNQKPPVVYKPLDYQNMVGNGPKKGKKPKEIYTQNRFDTIDPDNLEVLQGASTSSTKNYHG